MPMGMADNTLLLLGVVESPCIFIFTMVPAAVRAGICSYNKSVRSRWKL
jgi:hypothetical protein